MDIESAHRIQAFIERRDHWFAPFSAPPSDWPAPEQLSFGRYLAPLVVRARWSPAAGWSSRQIVPRGDVQVSVASGTVQYGLSVFEGLKAYRAADGSAHLFRPHEHAVRLRTSAARLGLPEVDEDLFIEACRDAVRVHEAFLPPHGRGALYLRPTIAASEEALGYRAAIEHQFSVTVMPCCDPPLKTVMLWAEPELTRASAGGLGAAKTGGNYAAGLLGQMRARERGFDDVAWLDAATHSRLAEAGTMNLFVEVDRTWITPPLDGTILAGVTRDTLITLLREDGLRVEEADLALEELARFERAGRVGGSFGCGTAARLVRISAIRGPRAGVQFRDGGHVLRFSRLLKQAQEGSSDSHDQWRLRV
ncbi:MAG: ilvE [Panacagrimonas sp.]|jgi:branched-chain amino acid aminotransferase|nr:branched-chain-amino-acid transaminase [Panacagrimonas sp.]MCC2656696.1 ilvE [Panacagrimonas sp.]